jgi:hypothetical protein
MVSSSKGPEADERDRDKGEKARVVTAIVAV